MKRLSDFLQVVLGVAFLAVLALVLVVVFRGVSGSGGADVSAGTQTPAGYPGLEGYPPPETTVATVVVPTPPTEPPTPTSPPVPTPLPTPVVTVIPTSDLPIIPSPTGKAAKPYTIVFQDTSVLHAMTSSDSGAPILLDIPVPPPFSLIASNSRANVRPWAWGSLSPDGTELALVLADNEAPTNIYILNLANRGLRRLAQFGVEPVWSPDGTRIAYRNTQTFGLWVAEVLTGETKEILPTDQTSLDNGVNFITWSPDSRRIAFVKPFELETGAIWITDVAGEGNPVQLVPEESRAGSINWSPAGSQILFISDTGEHVTPERPLSLWVVDVGTGERRQLTQNITLSGADWSPDGQWIIFTGVNLLEGGSLPYDLWLITKDGNGLRRLTKDEVGDHEPFWTSDPGRVIFRKIGMGIWELNLDTGAFNQLFSQDIEYLTVR
ncbi:MAG TPA: hypothetical protein VJL59_03960 [Anaerolineales bacterium]|nr:hypothetical protein [Anaerolineales bacterium]